MSKKKNRNKQPTPAVTLRKSPRFLQIVLADPADPITPDPEPRRTRIPSSASPLTLTGINNDNSKIRSRASVRSNHCCRLNRNNSELIIEDGVNKFKQFGNSIKNKVKRSKRKRDNNVDRLDTLAIYDDDDTGKQDEVSDKCADKSKNGAAVCTTIVVHEGLKAEADFNKTINNGWTKDQELALEKAYIGAKPNPHFWKNVSRLVPGKSAQECFDKIHSSHLTPPPPRLRSRSRVSNSNDLSFPASKLLDSSSPKRKKPRYHKQKSHVIQRTVRHMLQNQYNNVNQVSDADLFSVLEPTFTESVNCNLMLTTPDRNPVEVLKMCRERSSTVKKKSVSRFSTLVSPPVLKEVKNKALHEKYIDQLNCREAKRKAAYAKAEKVHQIKGMKQESSVERKNAIKDAKNALVFGAKDAINEFQHYQAKVLSNLFDNECDVDADEGV
ncbi:uncharacterized protein [Rutidosis leptorrhynchoides]|uniref:uncharacterized protein isoform X1 n=1 Tax=Rutidosis leptorrhynchoides TaxID=125765 RepID=UPI003A98E802